MKGRSKQAQKNTMPEFWKYWRKVAVAKTNVIFVVTSRGTSYFSWWMVSNLFNVRSLDKNDSSHKDVAFFLSLFAAFMFSSLGMTLGGIISRG